MRSVAAELSPARPLRSGVQGGVSSPSSPPPPPRSPSGPVQRGFCGALQWPTAPRPVSLPARVALSALERPGCETGPCLPSPPSLSGSARRRARFGSRGLPGPDSDQSHLLRRRIPASDLPAEVEFKHLLPIRIPIVTFSLATMDLSHPATLESISNSIIRPSVQRPLKKLYRGEPMALGITQILIGVLEIAFGVVIVMIRQDFHRFTFGEEHILTPYWTGIPYLISGSLSVAVAKKPEIPLAKGMLGMNVVSALAAGVAIVMLSILLALTGYYNSCDVYLNHDIPAEVCQELVTIPHTQMRYMTAVLLAFSVLELLIAIVSAAFGCATLCRSTFSETTVVIFQNTAQGAPPAVLTPVKEDEVL